MFKMLKSSNARTIYYGEVQSNNGKEIVVSGTDWDKGTKSNVATVVVASLEQGALEKAHKIPAGSHAMFMFLPDFKDPLRGKCEAIALPGEVFVVGDEKNRETCVINGIVSKGKKNASGKLFDIIFKDLVDAVDGSKVGSVFKYSRYGLDFEASTCSVTFFSESEKKKFKFNAKNAERELKVGTCVGLVASVNESTWNGEKRTRYCGQRYSIAKQ